MCPTRDNVPHNTTNKELHDKEKRLLKFISQLKYGEITIKVQDGLPVMVEKAMEKVKL